MNKNLKDWQIAKKMFGKNTRKECRIVKELRKYGKVTSICDEWSVINDIRLVDDCGWLIENELL